MKVYRCIFLYFTTTLLHYSGVSRFHDYIDYYIKGTKPMNGKIYRISHKTIKNSDLQYIGQTIKDIDQRLQEHIRDCNKGKRTKLHETMRMYGYINFEIELLEDKIKTEALLNERECFYIQKYDSIVNGLNTNEGNIKSKKVIILSPKEQLIQFIQSYLNENVSDIHSKYIIQQKGKTFITNNKLR